MRACYLDLDGTVLGAGGSLLRDGGGAFTTDGVRALGALAAADVPVVIVSGRRAADVAEDARVVGAAGWIAELGALDCGYPVAEGQSVHDAITATGVPDHLLALAGGALVPYAPWCDDREGSHLLVGRAAPEVLAAAHDLSRGTLRLVDNGCVDAEGRRSYHLLPAAAGKGPAVARDAATRGVDLAASLAVGDSRADLELVGVLGTVALVANSVTGDPTLADDAPWITAGSYGAGVLEAVGRWLAGDPALDLIR